MSPRLGRYLCGLSLATLALSERAASAQDRTPQPAPTAPPADAPSGRAAPQGPSRSGVPGADPGKATELPKLLETAEAEYPSRALDERVTAEVTLDIDLDPTGAIENVVVKGEATAPGYGFEDAAVA